MDVGKTPPRTARRASPGRLRHRSAPLDQLPAPAPEPPPRNGGRRRGHPMDARAGEARKEFMQYLQIGSWRSVAARAVGWSADSVEAWIRRGRGADPQRAPTARYVEFARDVDVNEAKGELNAVGALARNATRDYNAARYILQNRYPDRWGPDAVGREQAVPLVAGGNTYVYVDQRRLDVIVEEALDARAAELDPGEDDEGLDALEVGGP